jgi:NAD(P)-dependent dehydrogenase (short-subunit alcohol dehydrogenase family)
VWTRAAWRHWMAEHGGVMINVASVGGLRPAPAIGAYNISESRVLTTPGATALTRTPGASS